MQRALTDGQRDRISWRRSITMRRCWVKCWSTTNLSRPLRPSWIWWKYVRLCMCVSVYVWSLCMCMCVCVVSACVCVCVGSHGINSVFRQELYDTLEKERPSLFRLASDTDEKDQDAISMYHFLFKHVLSWNATQHITHVWHVVLSQTLNKSSVVRTINYFLHTQIFFHKFNNTVIYKHNIKHICEIMCPVNSMSSQMSDNIRTHL